MADMRLKHWLVLLLTALSYDLSAIHARRKKQLPPPVLAKALPGTLCSTLSRS